MALLPAVLQGCKKEPLTQEEPLSTKYWEIHNGIVAESTKEVSGPYSWATAGIAAPLTATAYALGPNGEFTIDPTPTYAPAASMTPPPSPSAEDDQLPGAGNDDLDSDPPLDPATLGVVNSGSGPDGAFCYTITPGEGFDNIETEPITIQMEIDPAGWLGQSFFVQLTHEAGSGGKVTAARVISGPQDIIFEYFVNGGGMRIRHPDEGTGRTPRTVNQPIIIEFIIDDYEVRGDVGQIRLLTIEYHTDIVRQERWSNSRTVPTTVCAIK